MIVEGTGNIIVAQAEALVNTVNTVGIMGKGIALQFKAAFPDNYKAYERACRDRAVVIGKMYVTRTGMLEPQFIINFPTKNHWKGNSRIEDIRLGLEDLVKTIRDNAIRSIAIPPLGCGLGGLRWEDVHPLIIEAFDSIPEVEVILFAPGHTVSRDQPIVKTMKPAMNDWRAALISIVDAYAILGFEATHIEAQKLIYLLQRAGLPIKCDFQKGKYGPYDQGMKHAIQALVGHYVTGFGDGGLLEAVRLMPGAIDEARTHIADSNNVENITTAVAKVTELIEGFETPYGLELLATVDWVVTRENASDEEQAVRMSHQWNDRKSKVLQSKHISIAYQSLKHLNWF